MLRSLRQATRLAQLRVPLSTTTSVATRRSDRPVERASSGAATSAMDAADGDPNEVLVADGGGSAVVVTMNRQKALNSLNTNMVHRMLGLYQGIDSGANPKAVVLKGAGEKAFCAGGDVRRIVELTESSNTADAARFFRTEYRLNFCISQLRTPHVALMDGVTMGGGVGVSVHGSFRVATERTLFAMPELAIGLFPDVGGSYFLPRLPGELGMYLALTGARLRGAAVKEMGIATHFVSSASIPTIEHRLLGMGEAVLDHTEVDKLLREFEVPMAPVSEGLLAKVDTVYGKQSLPEVVQALAARAKAGDEWARSGLAEIAKGSPYSAMVTFEQLRRGRHLSLAQCLEMEYALALHFAGGCGDFAEGVRAVLVDKDNSPKWKHADISQVQLEEVLAAFDPLPAEKGLGLVEQRKSVAAGGSHRSSL